MGPTLILEKATVASGESLMTSAGTPLVVAHVPRATPGCAGGALAAAGRGQRVRACARGRVKE